MVIDPGLPAARPAAAHDPLALRPAAADAAAGGASCWRASRELAPELAGASAAPGSRAAQGSIGRALELEASGWLERYADLLGKLVAARASPAARLTLASKLVPPSDGQGFRATADLIGAVLRRVAALQAGRRRPSSWSPARRPAGRPRRRPRA